MATADIDSRMVKQAVIKANNMREDDHILYWSYEAYLNTCLTHETNRTTFTSSANV
jgi:hypothetical protein